MGAGWEGKAHLALCSWSIRRQGSAKPVLNVQGSVHPSQGNKTPLPRATLLIRSSKLS